MRHMNTELTIQTEPVEANLSFLDGHREEVLIYLPEQEGYRASPADKLIHLFNDVRDAFLAVRRKKGGTNVLIILKSRIRWVEIEEKNAIWDEDRAGRPCSIGISFPRGDKLRGTIFNDLPQGKHRVLDFMNQTDPYFLLERDDRAFLVSRAATSRIDDHTPNV